MDGIRVHHVRRGSGPPVVCLHGLAGLLEDFTRPSTLERLANDFDALVLDRPGYGHSTRPSDEVCDVRAQADWLVSFFDRVGFEAPIVVGHSLGGALALSLGIRHSDRVRGLVLVAPYAYPQTEPDDLVHALPDLPGVRTVVGHTLLVPVARLLEPWLVSASFDPQPIPADYHRVWLDRVTQPDHFDTTVAEVRAVDPALADLRETYPILDLPTVVISGTEDRSVDPEANAQRLAGELSDAELVLLEGQGHMVTYTHPGTVVDAVHRVHERAQARDQDRSPA